MPIGYRIQDKHLVIDPEEADKARQIFDSFAVSGSIGEAARMAAALGHPFHRKTIKNMLTNRKYIGEHRGIRTTARRSSTGICLRTYSASSPWPSVMTQSM